MVPKVLCEWTVCKHNNAADSDESGECLCKSDIVLKEIVVTDSDVKMECQQFEWGNEE